MIVDAHVHVWPDKLAAVAIGDVVPELDRHGDGRVSTAVSSMRASGVDRAISLGVATAPAGVDGTNRFAGSLDPAFFVGFGSIHPELGVADNLTSLRANGLKGAKVHPLFQGYALDDPRLLELLDAMQGEFAIAVHVGNGASEVSNARAAPALMRALIKQFPRLDIIACHFGGYRLLEEAEDTIVGLPVFLDTSWPPSLDTLDPGRVRRLIERHGPERVVFGSDWPMGSAEREITAIRALGLSDADTDAVLGGNLVRLLALGETG